MKIPLKTNTSTCISGNRALDRCLTYGQLLTPSSRWCSDRTRPSSAARWITAWRFPYMYVTRRRRRRRPRHVTVEQWRREGTGEGKKPIEFFIHFPPSPRHRCNVREREFDSTMCVPRLIGVLSYACAPRRADIYSPETGPFISVCTRVRLLVTRGPARDGSKRSGAPVRPRNVLGDIVKTHAVRPGPVGRSLLPPSRVHSGRNIPPYTVGGRGETRIHAHTRKLRIK